MVIWFYHDLLYTGGPLNSCQKSKTHLDLRSRMVRADLWWILEGRDDDGSHTTGKYYCTHLYPVVSGMPPFFQMICGLGLPPIWHSNTTLPPSTSFWTLSVLMKKGAVAAASDSAMLTWDMVSSLVSSVTLETEMSLGPNCTNNYL